MKFTDLNFEPHPNIDGIQAVHFFDNSYGVSVIKSEYSYGGRDGLYEVAVLRGNSDEWDIVYDTSITEDVVGYLSKDGVDEVLMQVENLT
jgi:hypothetical protein